MPLSHCINKKVFVTHGGLFAKDGVKLDDIRKVNRNKEPGDEGIMCECLWSDPCDMNGRHPSKRGVGVMFGPDVTERFLTDNDLSKCLFFLINFNTYFYRTGRAFTRSQTNRLRIPKRWKMYNNFFSSKLLRSNGKQRCFYKIQRKNNGTRNHFIRKSGPSQNSTYGLCLWLRRVVLS